MIFFFISKKKKERKETAQHCNTHKVTWKKEVHSTLQLARKTAGICYVSFRDFRVWEISARKTSNLGKVLGISCRELKKIVMQNKGIDNNKFNNIVTAWEKFLPSFDRIHITLRQNYVDNLLCLLLRNYVERFIHSLMLYVNKTQFIRLYSRPRKCKNPLFVRFTLKQRSILTGKKHLEVHASFTETDCIKFHLQEALWKINPSNNFYLFESVWNPSRNIFKTCNYLWAQKRTLK